MVVIVSGFSSQPSVVIIRMYTQTLGDHPSRSLLQLSPHTQEVTGSNPAVDTQTFFAPLDSFSRTVSLLHVYSTTLKSL